MMCLATAPQAAGSPQAWIPVGLSGGGAMFCPAISPVDPQRMIVHCDMSGAYRSEDGGHHWALIHADQLQGNVTCKPAYHPVLKDVVFSPSGWNSRLKVSRDGGRTWEFLGDVGGAPRGAIAVDPDEPARMLVGLDDTAAISRDGGTSWARCPGVSGGVIGFVFDRTSDKTRRVIFAATSDGVFRTDDGGMSWAAKNSGLPWRGLRGFCGGTKNKTPRLYCTVPCKVLDGTLAGGIYVSTDRGEHWTPAMGNGLNKDTRRFDQWAMGDCVQYHQILTTDTDPLRVYAFNANTAVAVPHHTAVYRSDDGGLNWRPTYFPDPRWPGYNCLPNTTTVTEGQFYQCVPNGVAICATNPDILMQLGDGDCVITANGGKSWFNGDNTPVVAADAPAGKNIAAFRNTGLVVTTTWNGYCDPFDRNRRYICYTDIGLGRSLDSGATWRRWGAGARPPWQNTCYELAFDPEEKGRIWGAFSNVHDIPNDNIILGRHNASGPGGICMSDDFAASWKPSNAGLPVAPVLSVVLDPKSPRGSRTLFAGIFGHGVFKSTDNGKTWQPRNEGLGSSTDRRVVRVQLHRDGMLFALVTALRSGGKFVADGPGLYRSRDAGGHWEIVNASQPLKWPKDFAVDPGNSKVILIAAADAGDHSGGLYGTRDGGTTWKLLLRKGPQHFSAAFSPFHAGWIYATLTEGAPGPALWLSKDRGATWRPFESMPFRNAQRLAFDPADPATIHVTTFGASVLKGPAEPAIP